MTNETTVNKHRWLILGIVLAAEIMDLLDSTIVPPKSATGLFWVVVS